MIKPSDEAIEAAREAIYADKSVSDILKSAYAIDFAALPKQEKGQDTPLTTLHVAQLEARCTAILSQFDAALELLKESLRLSNYAVLSELSSSSHNHGPKRAAPYGDKCREIEMKISAFIKASAAPPSSDE